MFKERKIFGVTWTTNAQKIATGIIILIIILALGGTFN